MERGTPTWSTERFGSAVMTVRAEKSTRLPMRLPRMRPSLPFKRCRIVFSGLPPRCFSWTPSFALASLSNSALTLYCNSSSNCPTMCGASPARQSWSSVLFAFTMLTSWCVRSSSDRWPASPNCTDGRTCGGGTGSTVTKSHSGRACFGSRPRSFASRSEMFRRTSCARCADRICFRSPEPGTCSSSFWNSTSNDCAERFRNAGWRAPQPYEHSRRSAPSAIAWSSSSFVANSQRFWVRQSACMASRRRWLLKRCAAMTR
mmetsp:Transcript_22490/g.69467  ORF Transcript_22490/g.69467 Transcript_22490/m.69467 type:complete len:260 (+) Transcript_22490:3492-4271(+)